MTTIMKTKDHGALCTACLLVSKTSSILIGLILSWDMQGGSVLRGGIATKRKLEKVI
jgi:hypothetical protein